jgi:hypothetical protein
MASSEHLEDLSCGVCGHAGEIYRFHRRQSVDVRGIVVEVTKTLRRCDACGTEFQNSRDPDWRPEAYRLAWVAGLEF